MAIGCVLVIVILVAFLWDWRTALISTTAIPLSLVAAALVLRQAGVTINTMVLAGLIIALGEVVDDAIIDVENIVRRLRLNREAGSSAIGVSRRAGRVDRSAQRGRLRQFHRDAGHHAGVLPGRSGRIVLPAAGDGLRVGDLRLADRGVDDHAGHVAAAAARPVGSAPRVAVDHAAEDPLSRRPAVVDSTPSLAALALVAVLVGTLATVPYLGEEFLPNFQEYDFLMHWVEKPGTSIEAMDRITVRASQELRARPGRA